MRKKLISIFLSILTLTSCASSGSSAIQNVNAEEFLSTISSANVNIIDVRTAEEFNSGHVKGAVNLSVESGQFDAALSDLDKSAQYALYCRSGRRATIAAEKMADAGFTSIVNLSSGGFVELANRGAPTE